MTPIGVALEALTRRADPRERDTRGEVDAGWQRAMEEAACAEWFKPWQAPHATGATGATPPSRRLDVALDPAPRQLDARTAAGREPGTGVTSRRVDLDVVSTPRATAGVAAHPGPGKPTSTVAVDAAAAGTTPSARVPNGDAPAAAGVDAAPVTALAWPSVRTPPRDLAPSVAPAHRPGITGSSAAMPTFAPASPRAAVAPSAPVAPPARAGAVIVPGPHPASQPPVAATPASHASLAPRPEAPARAAAVAGLVAGLASSPLPPVRVHVERHGDHADVWIGADAAIGGELADVVAHVARTLQRIGLVPRRIVCNGHAVPLPRPEHP